jgi:hypothetical protein
MKTFSTYIILYVLLVGGLVSLYRAFLSSNDLTNIKAKVLEKKIEPVSNYKGSNRYGLTLKVDNSDSKLGIYSGTRDQSSEIDFLNLVDTGKTYSFGIDPTVSSENGINLGVRQIALNGRIIYKESKKFNLFLGVFFTLLGGGGIFVINKFKRKKNAS